MKETKSKYDNVKGVYVAGWVDHDVHKALVVMARENDRTLGRQINHILKQATAKQPKRRALQAAE